MRKCKSSRLIAFVLLLTSRVYKAHSGDVSLSTIGETLLAQ